MSEGKKKKTKRKSLRDSADEDEAMQRERARLLAEAEVTHRHPDDEYQSDVGEYVPPMSEDEPEYIVVQWANRAAFFPNEYIGDTCKWYQKVLTGNTFLPEKLKHLFDITPLEVDTKIDVRTCDALHVRILNLCATRDFGISRACLAHFFGHIFSGYQQMHPRQYKCYTAFLAEDLTRFEREQILFVLCIESYNRLTDRDQNGGVLSDHYYNKICDSWSVHRRRARQVHKSVDWDIGLHSIHGWPTHWLTNVVIWWIAQDRTLFWASADNPDLPPPPLLEKSAQGKDAESYHRRLIRGEQKFKAKALWR